MKDWDTMLKEEAEQTQVHRLDFLKLVLVPTENKQDNSNSHL